MLITDTVKIDDYYEALVEKNSEYTGIFFVGVKTTSIFCIATCTARKPKKENVIFYSTFKDALDNGFRPCKVCKPTQNAHEAPSHVKAALDILKNNPKDKITNWKLKQKGISPESLRRWFNKNYGMTFQAYQRMYRINNAFLELKSGNNATSAAFDSGYESLSGFAYTYKKLLGSSPKHSKNKNVILISRFTTPLGPMFVCSTDKGICLLEFVDRRMLETEFKDLQRLLKANIIAGENVYINQAIEEMKEYFDGNRKHFEVALDTPGTDFQKMVWDGLMKIPYGTTSSYQSQAALLDKPNAVRAMASANGHNRVSIMIPCHRVIGKDGALRGYGGGLERKRWLLELEGAL